MLSPSLFVPARAASRPSKSHALKNAIIETHHRLFIRSTNAVIFDAKAPSQNRKSPNPARINRYTCSKYAEVERVSLRRRAVWVAECYWTNICLGRDQPIIARRRVPARGVIELESPASASLAMPIVSQCCKSPEAWIR